MSQFLIQCIDPSNSTGSEREDVAPCVLTLGLQILYKKKASCRACWMQVLSWDRLLKQKSSSKHSFPIIFLLTGRLLQWQYSSHFNFRVYIPVFHFQINPRQGSYRPGVVDAAGIMEFLHINPLSWMVDCYALVLPNKRSRNLLLDISDKVG